MQCLTLVSQGLLLKEVLREDSEFAEYDSVSSINMFLVLAEIIESWIIDLRHFNQNDQQHQRNRKYTLRNVVVREDKGAYYRQCS